MDQQDFALACSFPRMEERKIKQQCKRDVTRSAQAPEDDNMMMKEHRNLKNWTKKEEEEEKKNKNNFE